MRNSPNVTQRVLVAVVVSLVAVPAATTALFLRNERLTDGGEAIMEINKRAYEDRSRLRRERRAYWRAIEQYQRAGEARPDVNDRSSVEKVLNATEKESEEMHASPPVTSLTTSQLSRKDKSLLRRYTRAKMCPKSMANLPIIGFYELCLSIVGEDASLDPVVGLKNYNQYLHTTLRPAASTLPAFKLRMQMMSEALDRSNRRENSEVNRPKKCFGGVIC